MSFEHEALARYQFANSISTALEMYPNRDVIVVGSPIHSSIEEVLHKFPNAKRIQFNRLKVGDKLFIFLDKFDSRIMGYQRDKIVMVHVWKRA